VYGADWNKPDLNGVTPLMKAAALNRVYFVEKLLQLGANKHLKDNRGMTALDYGILYDSFDSIDKINEV
jgi:ankyrin repeat protein